MAPLPAHLATRCGTTTCRCQSSTTSTTSTHRGRRARRARRTTTRCSLRSGTRSKSLLENKTPGTFVPGVFVLRALHSASRPSPALLGSYDGLDAAAHVEVADHLHPARLA